MDTKLPENMGFWMKNTLKYIMKKTYPVKVNKICCASSLQCHQSLNKIKKHMLLQLFFSYRLDNLVNGHKITGK